MEMNVAQLTRVTDCLLEFMAGQLAGSGRECIVLGLSGGIDSALVATLAARALGAARVRPYMLPCRPARAALDDARLVADWLKVDAQVIDLQGAVAAAYKALDNDDPLRLGNMMARLRMIALYDRAALHRGLVAGTGNKSEWLLGYFTRHGDAACDCAPLLDLYKTQVWSVSAHLGIPDRVLRKAPTADLWEGQTDEGELGVSYQEADGILTALTEEKADAAAVRRHFGAAADRVMARIAASAFKRTALPFPVVQKFCR